MPVRGSTATASWLKRPMARSGTGVTGPSTADGTSNTHPWVCSNPSRRPTTVSSAVSQLPQGVRPPAQFTVVPERLTKSRTRFRAASARPVITAEPVTPRAWLLFAVCSAVWGVPYVFIKVAVDSGLPPAFVAWARIALAALLLVPWALHRGALRGLRGRWPAIAAYAACEIAVPFVLIATGEQYISSSLTAILIATMPLLVALLSVRLSPADRPTGRRLVGLVIGLGGVVALLGVDVAGRPDELLGAALA